MSKSVSVGQDLELTRVQGRTACLLRLAGVIDATFASKLLLEHVRGALVFDLDGVKRVTSFGVREWIAAMGAIDTGQVYFVRCRPAIVNQFNIVANFGGKGQMVSFYAPYQCGCGKDFEILVDLRHSYAEVCRFDAPSAVCPSCGETAEFDDVPEMYFAYAASSPAPVLPRAIDAFIDDPTQAQDLKVSKEVSGNVTALWISGPIDERARFKRVVEGLEGDVVCLLEGVTSATAQAVASFLELARGQDVTIYLARASAEFLFALSASPAATQHAAIVSARMPFHCEACDLDVEVDVEKGTRDGLAGDPNGGPPCPVCGRTTRPDVAPGVLGVVLGLPFVPAPPDVQQFLARGTADVKLNRPAEARPAPRFGVGSDSPDVVEGGIFGKYQLIRRIGTGGMAEIFLARQIGLDGFERLVAVKRIHVHLSQNAGFVDMFLQEARVSARLSHPNLVQIFDLGKVGDQYYLAMEYVRGWDLSTLLRVAKHVDLPVPIDVACRIVADVCAGLAAAHDYVNDQGLHTPIVHRDVSPSNILISQAGNVRVSDFGIAKAADTVGHTESGVVKGKAAYMAPERLERTSANDPRQDLFAAGVILHELLVGQRLFDRENQLATMRAIMEDPIPKVSELRAGADATLDAVVERALARDPEDRFLTAHAFQRALETWLAGRGYYTSAAQVAEWLRELVRRGVEAGRLVVRPDGPAEPVRADTLRDRTKATIREGSGDLFTDPSGPPDGSDTDAS